MFQYAENAYAALDFTGQGFITEQQFLDCIIVKDRIPFTDD